MRRSSSTTTAADTGSMDIHSRAMLVRLAVSSWDGRRFDKKITETVTSAHHAAQDSGRFNKHLLGGRKAAPSHAKAVAAAGSARATYYTQTLPWADEGWRLLPTANYEKFTDAMRTERLTFDAAVADFIADYPALRVQAKQLLGAMYRAEDYPTAEKLAGRFSFEIEFAPVPAEGDFRLDLSDDQVEEIRSTVNTRVERATKAAMADAWERLREVVSRVSERLSDPDAIFRDSLIGNVQEMVDLLARLNVTQDADLESMRQLVADQIASFEPDTLRANKKMRARAAKTADDILKAMGDVYGGGQ